jgi:predicted aconitase
VVSERNLPDIGVFLTLEEESWLAGRAGQGRRLAMELLLRLAQAAGAQRLIPVVSAHVDGCLYNGRASLDFALRLRDDGARVAVPTTLNSSSLDLMHPTLFRGDEQTRTAAAELMDAYVALGCRPTWTCAPYQQGLNRPGVGEQIAWAESNAVVFANSVLGARTNRYGDFTDICAAITGRVPEYGLHVVANRRATVLVRIPPVPGPFADEESFYALLGHWIGTNVGDAIPVIVGLPQRPTEDQLKVLGAAAASSGSIAMFHVAGVTPEAPTVEDACGCSAPLRTLHLTRADLRATRDALTTGNFGHLAAVSLGTPHFSVSEFEQLVAMLEGRRIHESVDFYVSTGRDVLHAARARNLAQVCERSGITLVVDTCTYISPIMRPRPGAVMTNSAKWAYYAPANQGVDVVFGTMRECVESAIAGELWRDERIWADA